MKKSLTLAVLALSTLGMVSCNQTASSGNSGSENTGKKETITLQFVPSNDAQTVLTRAKQLEPFFEKICPEYNFDMNVGTSYAVVNTALANGQIDGGFLTASGYAQESIENPGKVELLLSAARAGYKVQADDFPGLTEEAREKQREAMNGTITKSGEKVTDANKADAYVYRGEQSSTVVNYYCSVVLTLRDSERTKLGLTALDKNGDGEVSLAELHDAKAVWGTMTATSSSGFVYPTYYLYNHGYTKGFTSKNNYEALSADDQKLYTINAPQEGYPQMVDNLMNGQIDVAVGFFDIRYGSAFVQTDGKYHNDESLFTKTYTQAVLDPIMNDTVCVNAKISDAKKAAIKKVLKAAVDPKQGGDKNDDGVKNDLDGDGQPSPAYLVYQIYSHTGYVDGKDSDYDAAREMYEWTLKNSGK